MRARIKLRYSDARKAYSVLVRGQVARADVSAFLATLQEQFLAEDEQLREREARAAVVPAQVEVTHLASREKSADT